MPVTANVGGQPNVLQTRSHVSKVGRTLAGLELFVLLGTTGNGKGGASAGPALAMSLLGQKVWDTPSPESVNPEKSTDSITTLCPFGHSSVESGVTLKVMFVRPLRTGNVSV